MTGGCDNLSGGVAGPVRTEPQQCKDAYLHQVLSQREHLAQRLEGHHCEASQLK